MNLIHPPILFFFLGMLGIFLGIDLKIPKTLSRFLSLYLLLSIGVKGGVELNRHGLHFDVLTMMLAAVVLACVIPVLTFLILRRWLSVANAVGVAAAYGSVSVVTFITAGSFLDRLGTAHSDYMVSALALMESPAIVVGVLLYEWFGQTRETHHTWQQILRDALLNESNYLLVGSLMVGLIAGVHGAESIKPFTHHMFQGLLCLFLLDLGLASARQLKRARWSDIRIYAFAFLLPLVNACLGLVCSMLLKMPKGDAFMLTVLAASASYIAVPAAIRTVIPKASTAYYVTMPLALTFPFNVTLGLPIYWWMLGQFY